MYLYIFYKNNNNTKTKTKNEKGPTTRARDRWKPADRILLLVLRARTTVPHHWSPSSLGGWRHTNCVVLITVATPYTTAPEVSLVVHTRPNTLTHAHTRTNTNTAEPCVKTFMYRSTWARVRAHATSKQ